MEKWALSLSLSLMIWLNTFGEPKDLEKGPFITELMGNKNLNFMWIVKKDGTYDLIVKSLENQW